MVANSSELRTYYHRNWENVLPKLPLVETVGHLAGLTLPFVSLLYKPAGKVISFGSTFLNVLLVGTALYKAEKWAAHNKSEIKQDTRPNKTNRWIKVHAWSVIKNGAEFIGTIASLRIGLAVHTVMNLGEKSYKLISKFEKSTWNQTGKRMIPIVSNALYLLTLASFSPPVAYGVIGASLVFEAGQSFYKACNAYEEAHPWNQMKRHEAVAYGAMTVIFIAKVGEAIGNAEKASMLPLESDSFKTDII